MSKHNDALYLGHMLDYARLAHSKVAGISREQFDADDTLQFAVTHLIQIVGEAATQISPATRTNHPEVPWTDVAGMRHHIVHDYVNVDFDIVWETATRRLPALIEQLEKFTPPEPPSA